MKNLVFFSIIVLNSALVLIAQPIMKIDLESFDFGEIKEGGLAPHEFILTNTGNTPLIIADIKASCGCTTPEWSTLPIAPGATGKVKAVYNTAGRPGFFNKAITITTNAEPATTVVYIKGSVVKSEEVKKYTDVELKLSPKIIIDKPFHNFGKLEKGAKINLKINVQNLGRSDLIISNLTSSCNCVAIISKQNYIKSGNSGVIEIVYSPNGMNDVQDIVYIKSNDLTNPSQILTLKSKIVETLKDNPMMMENNSAMPFK